MCRRTQRSAFQLEMFRGIVFDPEILRELYGIRWGKRIGNERPEALN